MSKRSVDSKAKRYVFTSFDVEHCPTFDERRMEYLCYGRETCPDTGRAHLQGFICWSNKQRFSACKTLLPSAHWEPARGSVKENRDYCSKEGDFSEWGVPPAEQHENGNKKIKELYADADKKAREGKFSEIDSTIRIRHYTNLKKIREDEINKEEAKELLPGSIVGMWVQGTPGLGKTFFAKQFCRERNLKFYMKALNKWWINYKGEDVIILDDLDGFSAKHMAHCLKIWMDESPFLAESKGGGAYIRPMLFIITTNYSIQELWPDDLQLQEAIKRRVFAVLINRRQDFGCITFPENLSTIKNGFQKEIPLPSSSDTENIS